MKPKQTMLLIFIFIIILISLQCELTEPPANGILSLTVEDVSCTEAWLTLKTTDLPLPTSVTLMQNDLVRTTINLSTADTLLYLDSLLPKQTYTFQVSSNQSASGGPVSSNKANATTLDTTSHNFTWQTYTFGQHSSSVLYDVAIINENNIWAVGEIYMNDSLGQPDPNAYNAVHWNGSEWTIKRIYFPTVCGSTSLSSYPAGAIFAFDDGQIWISSTGDKIARLQNGVQIDKFCLPSNVSMSINKLWGSSSNDLYAVGNGGNIAHYQNGVWTKIESGTDLNINDIWGDFNEKTDVWEILAVASNYGTSSEKEILLLKNNNIQKVSTAANPTMEPLLTTWFIPNRKYYVAGSGIYQKHLLTDNFWKHKLYSITTFATTSIRGNGINDVVGVGAFGDVVHFNGYNWKNDYQEPRLNNGSYTEVAIKGNLIVAVGGNSESINEKAVVLFGRR